MVAFGLSRYNFVPLVMQDEDGIRDAMGMQEWGDGWAAAVETMRELRERKDNFS